MMEIDIVGEDPVTQAIIIRLINEYRSDLTIKSRLPARGGQIKNLAPKYNLLGSPIFLLTDLDTYECAPTLIKDWFKSDVIGPNFLCRIAQEEAETWLLADREGFSSWLEVSIDLIPKAKYVDRKKKVFEIICPLKPSLFMMRNIVSQSPLAKRREDLTPKKGASKGPAYNSALLPFIENEWDVENARSNSYSLNRAIERLIDFNP